MSVCLQGMVEELLMKRNGKKFKREDPNSHVNTGNRRGSWSYMKRDGSSHQIALSRSISTEAGFANPELHNKVSQSINILSLTEIYKLCFLICSLSLLNRLNLIMDCQQRRDNLLKTMPSTESETTTYRLNLNIKRQIFR
jgi:hypothetical protein